MKRFRDGRRFRELFEMVSREWDLGRVPLVDLHVHTKWTDGVNSVSGMYDRACALGLKTILFTEHARSTSDDWFADFATEVRALEGSCRAYVGVETRIRDFTGALEAGEGILALCDVVAASVHRFPAVDGTPIPFAALDADEALDMEFRLSLAALSNPVVDVLCHPFGMSARKYSGYPKENMLDSLALAATRYSVALEINTKYNSDPWWVGKRFRKSGALLSFGSDAHCASEVGSNLMLLKADI